MTQIISILESFDRITLEEMEAVKLMNRTDTKYVCPVSKLLELLALAKDEYRVQAISERVLMPYYTRYYDTPDFEMYRNHLHGKAVRQKVRLRRYVNSGQEFLEIKQKNNKGRTSKKRISADCLSEEDRNGFLMRVAGYDSAMLMPQIENNFTRLTLVNKRLTERVTVDFGLNFHTLLSDGCHCLDG
ncbi:MAG: VTC domain-containing protein, partial [Bacteroidaceae bacterium]|nr:VTC domain-containing protein [Bacteroidaceae bacterium]